jgi:hypothetical protein
MLSLLEEPIYTQLLNSFTGIGLYDKQAQTCSPEQRTTHYGVRVGPIGGVDQSQPGS